MPIPDRPVANIRIGRELFVHPRKVVAQLLKANADLPNNPEAAIRLVKRALATRSKKTRRLTIRTGWHGGTSFVYPSETFGPLAGKLEHEGAPEIDPALGLRDGSPQAWQQGMRNAFEASDYLIFSASVALSGPLFELAGEQEGSVFHFQPRERMPTRRESRTRSSSGKTLAIRVPMSTIGRARKSDLVSFAVTLRASEDYCYSHNNLVGALDEEGRALSGTGRHIKLEQLPYQMTSGRGTVYSNKAARDPDLHNLTWLLPVLSTGERSHLTIRRTRGCERRVPRCAWRPFRYRLAARAEFSIGSRGRPMKSLERLTCWRAKLRKPSTRITA
jgi:Domain of unknown function (DUF927)